MAAGIVATSILNHNVMMSIFTNGLLFCLYWKLKGKIFFQNNKTTAIIAPSWTTTKNIWVKSSLLNVKN